VSTTSAQTVTQEVAFKCGHRARRLGPERLLTGRGFIRLLFTVDAVMLLLAVMAAVVGARAAGIPADLELELLLFPPLALLLLYVRGMYRPRLRILILDGIGTTLSAVSVAAMVSVVVMVFTGASTESAPLIARTWVFAALYVCGGRIVLTMLQRRARARGTVSRPALIVGAGAIGARLARRLEEVPGYGLLPIGFLDADPLPNVEVADCGAPVLGSPEDLERVVAETGAEHVILAFVNESDSELRPLVRRCEELGLEVSLVPRLFDAINDRVALERLGGTPLLMLNSVDPKGWQFSIKHAYDRVFVAIAVFMLLPLFLAIALAVKLSSPGPLFYRQRRIGRDGHEFDMLKFRTMTSTAEECGEADAAWAASQVNSDIDVQQSPDRRTPIGRFLRRWSLDELPQLLNVLRGEMSLVGPRPERTQFVALFGNGIDRYTERHRVRSGITGWAQVCGYRGQTSLADRIEWDNYYIENWSLWLDFKILLMTVTAVLRGAGEAA
jgi:exopolysaccharide biosynthesis polyprenyl glycosylphosphotransferase